VSRRQSILKHVKHSRTSVMLCAFFINFCSRNPPPSQNPSLYTGLHSQRKVTMAHPYISWTPAYINNKHYTAFTPLFVAECLSHSAVFAGYMTVHGYKMYVMVPSDAVSCVCSPVCHLIELEINATIEIDQSPWTRWGHQSTRHITISRKELPVMCISNMAVKITCEV